METEGFIVTTQDQSFFTRNFRVNILHNGADPRWSNRPDIVIKRTLNKTCQLIDMNMPNDNNICAKDKNLANIKILKLKLLRRGK